MIREITSRDNRIYKNCQRLTQKKYRDKEGKYLIEGPNLIEEALNTNIVVEAVFICRGYSFPEFTVDNTYVIEERLFKDISQTENSQGIIAVVEKGLWDSTSLLTSNKEDSNYLVLDRLQDPGNIGTIIRTACGAGYDGVISIKGTADIYSPKVIRAAAGSVFRIPIVHVQDDRELRGLVTDLGKKLVVTCFDTQHYYFDEDLTRGIALIIGNEGNGVNPELIEVADVKVKIPMEGELESLNASVAAGILMYEAIRGKREEINI